MSREGGVTERDLQSPRQSQANPRKLHAPPVPNDGYVMLRVTLMSEIGTGLQNASGIRTSIERAGYAFVEAPAIRN